jgi:hypothetical protein
LAFVHVALAALQIRLSASTRYTRGENQNHRRSDKQPIPNRSPIHFGLPFTNNLGSRHTKEKRWLNLSARREYSCDFKQDNQSERLEYDPFGHAKPSVLVILCFLVIGSASTNADIVSALAEGLPNLWGQGFRDGKVRAAASGFAGQSFSPTDGDANLYWGAP